MLGRIFSPAPCSCIFEGSLNQKTVFFLVVWASKLFEPYFLVQSLQKIQEQGAG